MLSAIETKGGYVASAPIENQLSNHPLSEACYVAGAGYHQPHAVVMLSEEASQISCITDRQSIETQLSALLDEINTTVAPYEKLAFIAVTKDDWNAENGFLTPTLKIKRPVLDAIYGPLAKKWYEMKKSVIWEAIVKSKICP